MFIDEETAAQIKQRFSEMVHPVRLVVFSQALQHPESEEVKRLIEELATLDPRILVETRNFIIDADRATELRVERVPAVAILRAGEGGAPDQDFGVRFLGLPMQYDFGVLIDAIIDVSSGEIALDPVTLETLDRLPGPVPLQVFSPPPCPFCPRAVRLAYRFAIASENITADGVEVTGFPDLIRRYRVSSVPKTVVGETGGFVGVQPEQVLLQQIVEAATALPPV